MQPLNSGEGAHLQIFVIGVVEPIELGVAAGVILIVGPADR